MSIQTLSDDAVLAELGRRLRNERLNMNLARAELAQRIGISPDTVRNAEIGRNVSMLTFVRIARGLGVLDQLGAVLPDTGPSPVQLARRKGRVRQRASGSRARKSKDGWQW